MTRPGGFPPIVHRRTLWEPFITDEWRRTERDWNIDLSFVRDTRELVRLHRPGAMNFGAYDPDRSYAGAMFGFLATRKNRVLMTYSGAVYALGDLDFRAYVETLGFHEGGEGDFRFEEDSPALMLATGIRKKVAFMGNVWVPDDMRGGESGWQVWVRSLVMQFGMLGRALGHGAYDCENSAYFSRDRHVRSGYTGVTERRAPGVIYKGKEMMWMGYSGPLYIEDLVQNHAA